MLSALKDNDDRPVKTGPPWRLTNKAVHRVARSRGLTAQEEKDLLSAVGERITRYRKSFKPEDDEDRKLVTTARNEWFKMLNFRRRHELIIPETLDMNILKTTRNRTALRETLGRLEKRTADNNGNHHLLADLRAALDTLEPMAPRAVEGLRIQYLEGTYRTDKKVAAVLSISETTWRKERDHIFGLIRIRFPGLRAYISVLDVVPREQAHVGKD